MWSGPAAGSIPDSIMEKHNVLIVSDGTGETAHRLLKAAIRQFSKDILITRYANIRHRSQIEDILRAASKSNSLIVHTFGSSELRDFLEKSAEKEKTDTIDVLGPLVEQLSQFFQTRPASQPGLLHQVDEEYFDRVDAVEFAIRHDDGNDVSDLNQADIILVGVSRTSKSPLSIYLAQEGWRVANIPIAAGSKLPSQLFQVDPRKVVGLTIQPERLAEARQVRIRQLGLDGSSYADPDRIHEELEYARAVFEQNEAWPIIDVTGKSIEEVSQEILDQLIGRGRRL